ncbi:hypothetical protein ILUMI_17617 [Ignelater luminosus]|uniref:Uncharacterized protein n=1 Tax=Ignelater luminosus TaxID=2038154 RepID=A0A8K0CNQ2_IGNLU|nr:hypothetical protein ILUMI_17617 [Ignelater luminosus]
MNVVKETHYGHNHTTVHFAKTPIMSTYLVEMFVGKYNFREGKYKKFNGEVIPVRMYSPPEKLNNTEFAVQEMLKILKSFANYTGFDYMLPKLGEYVNYNLNLFNLTRVLQII